ncbi:hypothetical protein [Pseudomonas sp. S3_C01]
MESAINPAIKVLLKFIDVPLIFMMGAAGHLHEQALIQLERRVWPFVKLPVERCGSLLICRTASSISRALRKKRQMTLESVT